MPNWCENKVRIDGPVEKVYNMAKAVEEERLLEYSIKSIFRYRTVKWLLWLVQAGVERAQWFSF